MPTRPHCTSSLIKMVTAWALLTQITKISNSLFLFLNHNQPPYCLWDLLVPNQPIMSVGSSFLHLTLPTPRTYSTLLPQHCPSYISEVLLSCPTIGFSSVLLHRSRKYVNVHISADLWYFIFISYNITLFKVVLSSCLKISFNGCPKSAELIPDSIHL